MAIPAKLTLAVAATGLFSSLAHAAPPPASAFGRIPAVVDAALSPDGRKVAVLGGASDQRIVSIATIDKPGLPILQLGDVETIDVQWAGNDYVVATVAYWDKQNREVAYRMERHISVSTEGKAVARFLDNRIVGGYLVGSQPILGVTLGPPARVSVLDLAESTGSGRIIYAVWEVDPATGRGKLVERGGGETVGWAVDETGTPRVLQEIDGFNDRPSVRGRAKGRSNYRLVWEGQDFTTRRNYYGYSSPDDAIYLWRGGQLVSKRLDDGAERPVVNGPFVGQPWILWDPHRLTAAAVVHGAERWTYQWLDAEIAAVHTALTKLFSAQDVRLADWSVDRSRFIFRTNAPGALPAWYLFDRTRKELSPLGEEYPELKGAALGTTRWITYKARDGLVIPAYVTLPPGPTKGRLPLVVLPHGGPAARNTFEFDYLVQFLASRGYAVLQPQFRGSWGFGEQFERAGSAEWGGKMQTDLLDGVAALAATGEIDPHRACIAGVSFGGYAALAGVTLHPDAYRCAVSIGGISDLPSYLLEVGRHHGNQGAGFEELRAELGGETKGRLAAVSPRMNIGSLHAPVLLIHGEQDTLVRVEQSRRVAEILKTSGKPHELMILPDENQNFTKAANRTRMLEAIETFLAKNLPVAD